MGLLDFLRAKNKKSAQEPVSEKQSTTKTSNTDYKQKEATEEQMIIKFIREKNYSKALELLNSIFDEKNAAHWYNKGNILSNMRDFSGAIKCYNKALELDPKYIKAWYRKGWVHIALKQYPEAIECFGKVLALERWLEDAMERAQKTSNYNIVILAVTDHLKKLTWSQAAAISQAYVLMSYANDRGGRISQQESIKTRRSILLSYLVLRCYPEFSDKLPDMSNIEEFLFIKMPDFIFLNIHQILDVVEPPIAVEIKTPDGKRWTLTYKKTEEIYKVRIKGIKPLLFCCPSGIKDLVIKAEMIKACIKNIGRNYTVKGKGGVTYADMMGVGFDIKLNGVLLKSNGKIDLRWKGLELVLVLMFDNWELELEIINKDPAVIQKETLKKILEDAGKYYGIGDYAPNYGLFEVISFEEVKA
jgi:tetratricopeptide (TPR) repeat protein